MVEIRNKVAFRTHRQMTGSAPARAHAVPLGGGEFLFMEADNAGSTLELVRVEETLGAATPDNLGGVTRLSSIQDWVDPAWATNKRRTMAGARLDANHVMIIHYDNADYHIRIFDVSDLAAVQVSSAILHSGWNGEVANWTGLWQRPDGSWSVLATQKDIVEGGVLVSDVNQVDMASFTVTGTTIGNIVGFSKKGNLSAYPYQAWATEADGTTWVFCESGYTALIDRINETVMNPGVVLPDWVGVNLPATYYGPIGIINGKTYRPYQIETPTYVAVANPIIRSGSDLTIGPREDVGHNVDPREMNIGVVGSKFVISSVDWDSYVARIIPFADGEVIANAEAISWPAEAGAMGDTYAFPDMAVWSGKKLILAYQDLYDSAIYIAKAGGYVPPSMNGRPGPVRSRFE